MNFITRFKNNTAYLELLGDNDDNEYLVEFIDLNTNKIEYSTKIKKQDPSALEKFESLIFSRITSNSESLPSTFDGLEQISKLIKNLKTSK